MVIKQTNPLEVLNNAPTSLLLYGSPKAGKTWLAGSFPKAVFVACPLSEATTLAALPHAKDIKVYGVDTWADLCKASLGLAKQPATEEFKTLVIDNLTFAYQLCIDDLLLKQGNEVIGQNTWTAANRKMTDLLDSVMLANKDKNLILVAHDRVTVVGEGAGAERFIGPDFGPSLSGQIKGRLNGVFYLKIGAGNKRILYVKPRQGVDVGSRYKLKDDLTNPTADDILTMLDTYKTEVNSNGS